jgi:NADPH2:quinone reductase
MDAVGKDTFEGSLDSLRPLGMMISFGNASGPVPPFDVGLLGKKGSLKITRPTLFTHIADHAACQAMAKHLAGKVLSGDVKINIGQRFALRDVAKAHEALEARKTTGSTVLEI